MTPPHDAVLKAPASKLGWMTATFCAYQEVVWCIGEVLEPRAWSQALDWCDDLKQCMDKCDCSMLRKPHWWQRSFFLTNSDCSSRARWFVLGAIVELAMHVFLWDAKGSHVHAPPYSAAFATKASALPPRLWVSKTMMAGGVLISR